MKKKLISLVCALALAVGLVGCSLSTPDSVGTIGEVDIPSGLYLLAQFDAYQTAADLASDDQDATKVSSFLKATITVDDATGETAVVSDYVAQKTLENLESYAAIETRFDELGGVLTPVGIDTLVEESPFCMGKETIDGVQYLKMKPIHADFALLGTYKCDEFGNCWYKGTMRNFNVVMATAADTVIAECEYIVPVGDIEPENIHTYGMCVDYIVEGDRK